MPASITAIGAEFGFNLQDPTLFESRGLINGEWIESPNGKTFPVYEPASGRVLNHCADFGKQDIRDAVDKALDGFEKFFCSTTAKQRGQILRTWGELIIKNKIDLATILSLENGKTIPEASGEIVYAASFVFWFAEEATRSYGDIIPSSAPNTTVMTVREPVGVCGIITPWNFPAAMITRKIAPAFAAGCSVVIKPPSETPFSALALAKLGLLAGIPKDCIHVLPTKNREAASELAIYDKVAKISFTGSTRVGKILTNLAAGTMKKVSMELGGNAPFIVWDDADLEIAADGAMACKFRCTGQTCVCANRFIVHRKVIDDFTDRLTARVKKLKLGFGLDESVSLGPLVNQAAVQKVSEHIQDALNKGGRLVTGGQVPQNLPPGYFYEPTIITNGSKDMLVATDETFGPLAVIFSFETEEEALSQANATEFGLAGYFFTKDNSRVHRVAQKLQCGMVGVNTGIMSAAETPFGGLKESGYGREGSKYGLAEYQNMKAITIKY
ncbi:unnamed protein product [Penicillium viridicatum]